MTAPCCEMTTNTTANKKIPCINTNTSLSWTTKTMLKVVGGFIFVIGNIVTTLYVATFNERSSCLVCTAGSSIETNFIFLSFWNLWLSTTVYIGWAICTKCSKLWLRYLFQLCLPLSILITISYTWFIITTPPTKFFNSDTCHTIGAWTAYPKDASNKAQVMILIDIIGNVTIHYFISFFLLTIFMTHEIEFVNSMPIASIFITLDCIVIGYVHINIGPVYCMNNVYVDLCLMTLLGLVIAIILGQLHARIMNSLRCNEIHCCDEEQAAA